MRSALGLAARELSIRLVLPACLCALALTVVRCERNNVPTQAQRPGVEINGHVWRVEVALTRLARYRGLSFRQHLDSDAGMLFVYPEPDVMDFVMRDCKIPLDIAFISAEMRVVRTHTMAVEPDRAGRVGYSSDVPVQYALEVPSGALSRAKVKVGQKVTFLGPMPPASRAEPGP